MSERRNVWLGCLALIAVAVFFIACEQQESVEAVVEDAGDAMEEVVAETTEPMTIDVETQAKMTAVLAALDAADGATDMTVTKCMCGMDVEGSEHSAMVEGYTMNFCSVGCKDQFETSPAESVLSMEMPTPDM